MKTEDSLPRRLAVYLERRRGAHGATIADIRANVTAGQEREYNVALAAMQAQGYVARTEMDGVVWWFLTRDGRAWAGGM